MDTTSHDTEPIQLRLFAPSDGLPLLELFRDTVHRVNSRDYTPEQLAAWAPADFPISLWADRFEGKIAYVATLGEVIVGVADMSPSGYLDRLYVSADHQRQGVARRLLHAILTSARELRLKEVTTDASITAKPFFLAASFVVVQEKSVLCRSQRMTNFRMRYILS